MCRRGRKGRRPDHSCSGRCAPRGSDRIMRTTVSASRSSMPLVVLGLLALAIGWGLYVSGLAAEILRYKSEILYLLKQHLVLVGISGSLAIVCGIGMGVWLSRPWMARWAERIIQV